MTTTTFQIDGMSCGHCVAAVRRALEAQPGATAERVQVGSATVTFDPAATSAERIAAAIAEAGYPARPLP